MSFVELMEPRRLLAASINLVGNTLQARSFEDYQDILNGLIADPARCEQIGARSLTAVAREHNTPGWLRWLEAVYARALELPLLDNRAMLEAVEQPSFGEPDWRHEDIFGGNWPVAQVVKSYMGVLPLHQRVAHWAELRSKGVFPNMKSALAHIVLPEWLKRRTKDRRR